MCMSICAHCARFNIFSFIYLKSHLPLVTQRFVGKPSLSCRKPVKNSLPFLLHTANYRSSSANQTADKTMADDLEHTVSPSRYPSVSPELIQKWDLLQNEFRKKIIHSNTEEWQLAEELYGLKRVAGVDVSYPSKDHNSYECEAFAAVVICEFPTMKIIHKEIQQVHLPVPYAPGYLAFREAEPVVKLLSKIMKDHPNKVPDVLLVDGNGMLHPHRSGLACHVGIQTNIPTIGVAKNLHLVDGIGVTKQTVQGMSTRGDYVLIRDNSNEVLGMALKTAKDAINPMYVSIGHKISLETAKNVVLKCCKYKIPEPIRFADNISREFVRKMEEESQSKKT